MHIRFVLDYYLIEKKNYVLQKHRKNTNAVQFRSKIGLYFGPHAILNQF